jgi:NAD(P)-dependent dehydrogenase (short-subunit alcohol dehydrogenase family)
VTRFRDKVAIVTGASGGIGLATARRLASEGATVCLAGLDGAALDKEAAAIGGGAFGMVCDVSHDDAVSQCVEAVTARAGGLDIIVNNAGMMLFKPLVDYTHQDWLEVLDVDLFGAVNFLRRGLPAMRRGGAVVNVTSIHGHQTSALVAPYAAAKAAVESLTRSAAIEAKPRGIRVNAVAPGAVETPMLHENPNVRSGAEHIDPADVGRPEDIAAAIAFLASDDAAFVSGAVLWADGGRSGRL